MSKLHVNQRVWNNFYLTVETKLRVYQLACSEHSFTPVSCGTPMQDTRRNLAASTSGDCAVFYTLSGRRKSPTLKSWSEPAQTACSPFLVRGICTGSATSGVWKRAACLRTSPTANWQKAPVPSAALACASGTSAKGT